MISSLLLEAALRSVLLALAVWAGLRVFGVKNVLAQKAAWGLVLVSALTMPLLLPFSAHWSVLPANVRVVIPADPQTLLEELQARIKTSPQPKPPELKSVSETAPALEAASTSEGTAESLPTETSEDRAAAPVQPDSHATETPNFNVSSESLPQRDVVTLSSIAAQTAIAPRNNGLSVLTTILWLYLAVAGVLILRLVCGLAAALRLLHTAKPITLDALVPHSASLRLLCSARVASPVTICSSIVLPADYATWDSEKLRIVLAHERSHIRQGDFYLQLLAGVYAAAVWFSPLGWWLKRTLSDLAEAISDRAGLEEAADRTSYAQILLEFAASPRPTLIGVAMARSGSISRRIERLLNDSSFSQAFAGTRRGLVALAVVPVALFAATALVRVDAAGQQSEQKAQVILPTTGVVTPEIATTPQEPPEATPKPEPIGERSPTPILAPQAPEHVVTPKPAEDCAPAHAVILTPPAHLAAPAILAPVPPTHAIVSPRILVLPGTPAHSLALIAPAAPGHAGIMVLPQLAPTPPNASLALIMPPRDGFGEGHGYGYGVAQNEHSKTVIYSGNSNGKKSGYRYYFSDKGDSYAIVRGDGSHQMSFNGDIHSSDIDKARQQAGGKDFLWFRHEGKSYIVDDPATLAQIEAMYKPMEDLGRQQEELGKKQEALGKQQEDIGHQQEHASVPTPDMSKEIAEIEEAMAKLKASQGKNMTQDEFGDLQEKLGALQGRLGEIQGEIGGKQGEFGGRMGELGEKMGALGAQMGELGARQGKIAHDADQKVKSIIDQSLHNGKAHPVQ
jgi:beta-lactamase regulating signal transducer with metallopeptidase domain